MKYTLIYHDLLGHFDISMNEHALMSLIDNFSAQTGWCYASKVELGKALRLTSRWVFDAITRLEGKGLVEINAESRFLRACPVWKKAIHQCQNQLPLSETVQGSEEWIQAIQQKKRRAVQYKHRQAMQDAHNHDANQEDSEGYAENAQQPINTFPSTAEKTSTVVNSFPMQQEENSVSGMDYSMNEFHNLYEETSPLPVNNFRSGYEENSHQDMKTIPFAYEQNAHYNNIYSNRNNNKYKNKNNNNTITEKSACAQSFQFSNEQEIFKNEQAGEKLENFLKSEEQNQPVVEAAIVTPPQVAPAPSPKKAAQIENAMQNVHSLKTDSKATPVDPCLVPCREVYLLYFGAYKWVYGRDDKFLKQVLEQIRYKIAVQWQQPTMNLAEIPDESVIHSFQSLLEMIPTWYRDNGYTAPNDLNRFFEKYYAAIKSGNGGGARSSFAPPRDQDEEYLRLMRLCRD
ncbi:hypothetical protein [Xanthocytophaga agilis]|uniref:Uncharacterized protein n=1 Tax=Xanthocytophaga agilis TaxID=3048010 RepID=A0AAE3R0W7_9BACT|nr:hypothetical protein [Xanthocytophaga agilis]MDJ1499390.1 hypothetical protein [Xanthocytophaga agilis]